MEPEWRTTDRTKRAQTTQPSIELYYFRVGNGLLKLRSICQTPRGIGCA